MVKGTRPLLRVLPALLAMLVIFWFSGQPSSALPEFDWLDGIIKKGGHVLGYALLGLSYWWLLGLHRRRRGLAWLLAILYALTDEWHQSFVPGRSPSIWDVLVFDNLGAAVALWLAGARGKQKRPNLASSVAEKAKA